MFIIDIIVIVNSSRVRLFAPRLLTRWLLTFYGTLFSLLSDVHTMAIPRDSLNRFLKSIRCQRYNDDDILANEFIYILYIVLYTGGRHVVHFYIGADLLSYSEKKFYKTRLSFKKHDSFSEPWKHKIIIKNYRKHNVRCKAIIQIFVYYVYIYIYINESRSMILHDRIENICVEIIIIDQNCARWAEVNSDIMMNLD